MEVSMAESMKDRIPVLSARQSRLLKAIPLEVAITEKACRTGPERPEDVTIPT